MSSKNKKKRQLAKAALLQLADDNDINTNAAESRKVLLQLFLLTTTDNKYSTNYHSSKHTMTSSSSYVPLEGPDLVISSLPTSKHNIKLWEDAWGCWDDRVRYRYTSKNFQKDALFIRKHWPAPSPGSHVPTFVTDASSKVKKKYKRVVAVHLPQWKLKASNFKEKFAASEASTIDEDIPHECSKLLKDIDNIMPKVNGLPVYDLDESGSSLPGLFSCVTYLQFWTLQWVLFSKCEKGDHGGAILDANSLFRLFPTISDDNPIPYPLGIMSLLARARVKQDMNDLEGALLDYRCCATAMRLIMFEKNKYQEDIVQLLLKTCDRMAPFIVRLAVMAKVKQGAARPFFSTEAILECESELGIGSYSKSSYKCNCCGDNNTSKKLLYCTGCQRVPYCCRECQLSDWKDHKHSCGEKWRKQTLETLNQSDYDMTRQFLKEECNDGVRTFVSKTKSAVVVQCLDPMTEEIFDGWTDRPYAIESS